MHIHGLSLLVADALSITSVHTQKGIVRAALAARVSVKKLASIVSELARRCPRATPVRDLRAFSVNLVVAKCSLVPSDLGVWLAYEITSACSHYKFFYTPVEEVVKLIERSGCKIIDYVSQIPVTPIGKPISLQVWRLESINGFNRARLPKPFKVRSTSLPLSLIVLALHESSPWLPLSAYESAKAIIMPSGAENIRFKIPLRLLVRAHNTCVNSKAIMGGYSHPLLWNGCTSFLVILPRDELKTIYLLAALNRAAVALYSGVERVYATLCVRPSSIEEFTRLVRSLGGVYERLVSVIRYPIPWYQYSPRECSWSTKPRRGVEALRDFVKEGLIEIVGGTGVTL